MRWPHNLSNDCYQKVLLPMAQPQTAKPPGVLALTALPSSPMTVPCPQSLTRHRHGCRTGSEAGPDASPPSQAARQRDAPVRPRKNSAIKRACLCFPSNAYCEKKRSGGTNCRGLASVEQMTSWGCPAMNDNAEQYDLTTVLLRLEKGFQAITSELARDHAIDDHSKQDQRVAATDAGRTGLFRKMLTSLRSWRPWPDSSAPHKS